MDPADLLDAIIDAINKGHTVKFSAATPRPIDGLEISIGSHIAADLRHNFNAYVSLANSQRNLRAVEAIRAASMPPNGRPQR